MIAVAIAAALLFASPPGRPEDLPSYYGYSPDQERAADEALAPAEQRELAAQLDERDRLDATVWRPEVDAQRHEVPIDALWDRLRRAREPLAAARDAEFESLTLPAPGPERALKDGIVLRPGGGTGRPPLAAAEWRTQVDRWRAAGWKLVQSEWHHEQFHPEGTPPWSFVKVDLAALGPDGSRHEFRGRLRVTWREPRRAGDAPRPAAVDASDLTWLRRGPAPAFREVLSASFERAAGRESSMLLAWDLAGTGRSDLILPGVNARFRNLGGGRFTREPFLAHPVYPDPCGVIADFDGDGRPDYLCTAGDPQRLLLYRGAADGTFPDPPAEAGPSGLTFKAGSVIGVADVDGDGFPDVWVGQYRNPYIGGEFPEPYWDANDGYPCALLLNDGHGRFRDATAGSGFEAKRRRRNYGAAFLDLFGAGRPDLVTINDFAGVDVWRNLGGGRFEDATAQALDDPMNFGMGVAVDDFAHDGHLGLYVSGMGSTTMRRLEQLGLRRSDRDGVSLTRTRMGYGSRLYAWAGPGRWREPAWAAQVSRSGWSWGTVGFDPDLDGDRDLYVLNGFISGRTSQDYCTRFWCHDVYPVPGSSPKLVRHLLALSTADLNRGEISWNGYEKKRLFLRTGATEFTEAAWLLGLALEEDCRNLVADDFDLDGRPDVALLFEDRGASAPGGPVKFGLKVFRNEIATRNHWIGVRLRPSSGAQTSGALVTVRTPAGPRVAAVLTGDSWRSQQAPLRHFGLGDDPRVDAVEVRWPDGRVSRLDRPAADRYHDVSPPGRGTAESHAR